MYKNFDEEIKEIVQTYKSNEEKLKAEISKREKDIESFKDEIKRNNETMIEEGAGILLGKKKGVFSDFFKSTKRTNSEINEDIEITRYEKSFLENQMKIPNGILKNSILKMIEDLENVLAKYNAILEEKRLRIEELEKEIELEKQDLLSVKYKSHGVVNVGVEALSNVLESQESDSGINSRTQLEICRQFSELAFDRIRVLATK